QCRLQIERNYLGVIRSRQRCRPVERNDSRVVEQRDILRGVKIRAEETEAVQISVEVAVVFGRILPSVGRQPSSIAIVVLYEAAAAPELRLPIDAWSLSRCVAEF